MASKPLDFFDHKVQLLANYLLTKGSTELTPSLDYGLGVTYPEAERLTGDGAAAVAVRLEELAECGILERRFVSKLVSCPKCSSNNTPINYCCPQCRSTDIEKKLLFEHLACGVIDKEDKFKKEDQLVCPRCSRLLGELGITHKTVGTWFLCRSCQKSFDKPQSFHVCTKCRHFFVVEDATLVDVFAYKLSKAAEAQLKSGGAFLKPLKDMLESVGYEVALSGVLQGTSGASYRFDIVGTRKTGPAKETIVVDVKTSDGLVDEKAVAEMFAKRYDTNPSWAVLVAIPAIMQTGKKLAEMYKITLIEASSAPEAVEKLKASLKPVTN